MSAVGTRRGDGPPPDAGVPTVDVIMPLYDKRPVVQRALRSVEAQTFRDWRLTVVDDGSTDGGAALVPATGGDGRVRLLRQPNRGPGAARNLGLSLATAPFVTFLDADDEWMPTFLDRTLTALRGHPECAAVATSWYWGPDRESWVDLRRRQGIEDGPWRCPAAGLPFLELKHRVDACHSSAVVARREILVELQGFYERDHCTWGEDSWLWLRLLMQAPVYHLLEPLMWLHTDASELGHGRRGPYPVPPLLLRAADVLDTCPDSHRAALERYLDTYAIWVAAQLARQGQGRQARELLASRRPTPEDEEFARLLVDARRLLRVWPLVRARRRLGALRRGALGSHG